MINKGSNLFSTLGTFVPYLLMKTKTKKSFVADIFYTLSTFIPPEQK